MVRCRSGLRGRRPIRLDRDGAVRGRRDRSAGLKDAIFISPHKFIGGPGTPGVLVARRELFRNRVPSVPGGGTVAYVNPTEHRYLTAIEHREEGGTPAIVELIRAGLVFALKQAVGAESIRQRESKFIARAIDRSVAPSDDRDPREPRARSTVHRVVRRAPRRPRWDEALPPSQLRRRVVERPVRDPVAGRLLVRGAVWPSPPRHRPRAIARVRTGDRSRMRGDQAGLGPGQLQLFHQRARVRVHPRRGRSRRERWMAPSPALPVRARDRPVVPHGRCRGTAAEPVRRRLRRRPDDLASAPADGTRILAWRTTSTRHDACWPTPTRPLLPPEDVVVDDDFETLRWFPLPTEIAQRT